MVERQFRDAHKKRATVFDELSVQNVKLNPFVKWLVFYFQSPVLGFLLIGLFGAIIAILTFLLYDLLKSNNLLDDEYTRVLLLITVNFFIFGALGYLISKVILKEKSMRGVIAIDPLTQVSNRSYLLGKEDCTESADCSTCLLDCRLVKEIIRSNRYKKPFSFFIIDVDNFKEVNDKFGHIAGDIALKYIAKKIKESVRVGIDIVGRLSGDEFYVLLPENDQESSIIIAERVRLSVDSSPLMLDQDLRIVKSEDSVERMLAKDIISLSLSVGVAHFEYFDPIPNIMDAKKEVLKSADVALYQSKLKGRNKVSVSPVII